MQPKKKKPEAAINACPAVLNLLPIMQTDFNWLNIIGVSSIETNDRSAKQDQTARMCRLILLYTFRNIYGPGQ